MVVTVYLRKLRCIVSDVSSDPCCRMYSTIMATVNEWETLEVLREDSSPA